MLRASNGFTVNSSVSSDWLITLRPRVGFAANNWLVYVTGGLAVANLKSNFSFTDTFAGATESASISKTKAGWTVGVGTEYALMNGWSVKAEYLYVDLGSENTTSSESAGRRAVSEQRVQPLGGPALEHRSRRPELQVRWPGRRPVLSR